jgi:hypothetical protein
MTIKILTVFIACLFLSYSKPSYPNITVYVEITDKLTGQTIKGADCTLNVTFQTKECLAFMIEPSEEYSKIDTFKSLDKYLIYLLPKPVKKYVFEVKHRDYKTVIQRDSFKCKFDLSFDIALERKQ